MNAGPWPIAELLPHATPMLLLDQALSCDSQGATAALTIHPDAPFAGPNGVPAHIGIEYMAQTCGLWAGGEAKREGGPVRLGYLLGTRHYQASRQFFAPGERLEIRADLVFRDGGMGVFDCRIVDACNEIVAQAQLSVYQPSDKEGEQA